MKLNFNSLKSRVIILVIGLALLASLVGVGLNASAAATGPCDIYASGGTPCVAAHSTVRALYGAYSGNLYQVRRASDNTTKDIPVLAAGGYVNISVQDSFCSGTTCTISILYDQSSQHNDLKKAPAGATWLPNGGNESSATKGQATVAGHTVYGIYVTGNSDNVAYRVNNTTGVAKGSQAESMYMVVDGRRFSTPCCFDYGNAETNSKDNGNGTMEALYFGTDTAWGGQGDGNGPWIAADLENGMFKGNAGCYNCYPGPYPSAKSLAYNFVTAILKGPDANTFTLKGGNAQSGTLTTMWNSSRPSPNYYPKKLEGSIILGTGGDGSNGGTGTFYEGAMTIGTPSDAVDDAIQANIIAAGYGSSSGGPTPTTGPTSTPTNTPVPGANILTNADMESGTTNWVVNGAGTLSSDTTQFHAGTHSVKTTGRTANWNGIGQNVAVSNFPTSGQNYTVSVWVRSETGTPTGVATVRLTASTTTYINLASAAINSTGWTQLTGTVPVSWSGTLTGVLFYVETAAGTDNLYIDDASLSTGIAGPTNTPAPTATPTNTPVPSSNFLTNADMESGTTNWVVNGAGTLSSDTTQFHAGTHSVKTTGRTASWNGIGQNVAVANFPTSGQNTTVSVWVRSQTGTPTGIATLRLTASTTTYVQLASAAINSTGWTQLTGTVPVSWSGTLTGVLFYVETAAGTDNLYIDDANLHH